MAKRKCTLNDDWLRIKGFESWFDKGPNHSVAYCKLCQQSFDVSNMGRSALNSHAKGKKYKEKGDFRKSLPITFFRQETVDKPSTSKQSADTSKEQSIEAQVISPQQKLSQCTLAFMMLTSNVTEAEILWSIWTCLTHSSLCSCDGISKLFSRMFSDSNTAKSFSLARTKCGYFINFGVAPYLKDQLLSIIDTSTFFVVSHDE